MEMAMRKQINEKRRIDFQLHLVTEKCEKKNRSPISTTITGCNTQNLFLLTITKKKGTFHFLSFLGNISTRMRRSDRKQEKLKLSLNENSKLKIHKYTSTKIKKGNVVEKKRKMEKVVRYIGISKLFSVTSSACDLPLLFLHFFLAASLPLLFWLF